MPLEIEYEVAVGSDCVTVRRRGESTPRVGHILGREVIAGVERIYVDRLLVPPGPLDLTLDWSSSGCISTILTRRQVAD